MAGTIPISLTSQFGADGKPLVGGKIYFFQASTTTPQNIFSDTGLTFALPNPITLDSRGFCPQFFCADGVIKFRVTDSAGVVQVEADNVLVIGPSGGGGGAGATVDATTVFQTGDVIWQPVSGVRSGWVRHNARTIGSALSGASERANADCQALFTFLWNTYPDAKCPVIGGRGGSATSDWSANKQITTLDLRNKCPVGLADMGSTTTTTLTGALFSGSDTATTVAGFGGEATHTMTQSELVSHNHVADVSENPHDHELPSAYNPGIGGGSSNAINANGTLNASERTSAEKTNIGVSIEATGGSQPMNNMQPFVLGTFYVKI